MGITTKSAGTNGGIKWNSLSGYPHKIKFNPTTSRKQAKIAHSSPKASISKNRPLSTSLHQIKNGKMLAASSSHQLKLNKSSFSQCSKETSLNFSLRFCSSLYEGMRLISSPACPSWYHVIHLSPCSELHTVSRWF